MYTFLHIYIYSAEAAVAGDYLPLQSTEDPVTCNALGEGAIWA